MALLHSYYEFNNTTELAIATNQSAANHQLLSYTNEQHADTKWLYLISNHIAFSTKDSGAIRIKKPIDQYLFSWMKRIVLGGQCGVLFVENLNLDDVRTQQVRVLCEQHNVTLVNLTIDDSMPENVVLGPWH